MCEAVNFGVMQYTFKKNPETNDFDFNFQIQSKWRGIKNWDSIHSPNIVQWLLAHVLILKIRIMLHNLSDYIVYDFPLASQWGSNCVQDQWERTIGWIGQG